MMGGRVGRRATAEKVAVSKNVHIQSGSEEDGRQASDEHKTT